MARVLIFFAPGLEECEGLITVDILRRAGITVDIAAVSDELTITSAHNVNIVCDLLACDVQPHLYDAVVLPGGLPGSDNLEASPVVRSVCQELDTHNKLVCAICAAPGVLAAFGILKGEQASVFPGRESYLACGGATYTGAPVTVSNNHITGEALGAAVPFALEIVATLVSRAEATRIRNGIVYKG